MQRRCGTGIGLGTGYDLVHIDECNVAAVNRGEQEDAMRAGDAAAVTNGNNNISSSSSSRRAVNNSHIDVTGWQASISRATRGRRAASCTIYNDTGCIKRQGVHADDENAGQEGEGPDCMRWKEKNHANTTS